MRNADIIAWDVPGCKKKFFYPKNVYTLAVRPLPEGAEVSGQVEKGEKMVFIIGEKDVIIWVRRRLARMDLQGRPFQWNRRRKRNGKI